jgi:hypothetical protein
VPNKEGPVFGYPGVHGFWPAWYDGTTLITFDRASDTPPVNYLYLHRRGKEAAPLKVPDYLENFTDTPHGLLVTDRKGEGYLIVKKSLPNPAEAPEKPAKQD